MIELIGIEKQYGKKTVLTSIDAKIEKGEFFVFLGSSGSGKSTLLKIISGIETLDEGRVFLHGEDITYKPVQERNIGYIFQEPLLFPHMNVRENICYSLSIAKKTKEEIQSRYEKFEGLLQLEGLSGSMPHQLSGGQKQRVSLARSLINTPEILLMDEPFSSLDYNLRTEMGVMVKKLQSELGLTIIFVTHDIEESLMLADNIAFLNDGIILEQGFPQQMFYNPQFEETAKFMGEYNKILGEVKDGMFQNKYTPIPSVCDTKTEMYIRPNKIRLLPCERGNFIISDIVQNGKGDIIILEDDPLKIESFFSDGLKKGQRVNIEFSNLL